MNKRNLIYIVSYLIVLSIYYYFQGTFFEDGMFLKFSSVMLVSFVLYYYIDLANKGEVNLEKFLGRIAPITKFEMFRDIVGAPSYYEKD